MSDTLLEHPLVRDYLRQLDQACAGLPYAQARELIEQITGHLEDALAPDAPDADVKAELVRLGQPRTLAAEAAGIVPTRFPHLLPALRKLRRRLGRVRWWTWAAIAVLIPALGTGTGFLISMNTAAPLYVLETGWLYPVDQAKAADTSIGILGQTMVPIRSGQRQGIEMGVSNNSDWTQTILGVAPDWFGGSLANIQVTVESGPDMFQNGAARHGTPVYYASPGVIPPHSYRFVRVSWVSEICMQGGGDYSSFSDIPLTVKVGTLTRTEDVPLAEQTFALEGPSQGKCE